MQIKLFTSYKDAQFATNPYKAYMSWGEGLQTVIFLKFDLENDLLTMTLTYNHFENKFNQLGLLKTLL